MKLNKDLRLDFYQEEDKNKELLHDMSLKLIPTVIKHSVWKIRYSYKTKRGNNKDNYKYVIAPDGVDAKISFLNYMENFNKNNPHRALSNVKILETNYKGNIEQSY